jgi:hypothetical protein
MRSTATVALAVLLACLPGRAMELIDLHAAAQMPGQPSSQALKHQPVNFSLYFTPSYFTPSYSTPSHFRPSHFRPYFLPYSSPSSNSQFPPYVATQIPVLLPMPRGVPADDGADMFFDATLYIRPLPAEAAPPAAIAAVPLPVAEPVSVLMLACGLLVMVPGAWAARWSRLGDSESLLQRRLP